MSYTFSSPLAKEMRAYNLGYFSGFNQEEADTRGYTTNLCDKYYQGRRDGIDDYMATSTKTGNK